MSKTIALKIDVSKIEKARLFQGQKGTYLDAILFLEDNPDQYGQSGMIVQSVTQEERKNGVKGPILGNCKILASSNSEPVQPSESVKAAASINQTQNDGDDFPF